jgi:hypothetical protein
MSNEAGEPREVEWQVVEQGVTTRCGDDEEQARAVARRFGGNVQSRTITQWVNA